MATTRKIVHVDMDAFYASVEQRDDPSLRGKPVVVAWRGARSVVCAASYEARRFGVRSAMAASRAERLCPQAIFVPPDFNRYRTVSRQFRQILSRYTDRVEPLSLDEAYLDVTVNKLELPSATAVAEGVRREVRDELQLAVSAGVAPNKFLAKIASDWNKPDGLFVIRPEQIARFLVDLPVSRLPGVGSITAKRLEEVGATTVGQLADVAPELLRQRFGRFGWRLHELAHGIDERPVEPNRPTMSVSSEDTMEVDLPLVELRPHIARLAAKTWNAAAKTERVGRTVILKLKTSDFQILTRSVTPDVPPTSLQVLTELAQSLVGKVQLPPSFRFRLVGVGLGNFRDPDDSDEQPGLFDEADVSLTPESRKDAGVTV